MNIFIDCGTHFFEGFNDIKNIHNIDNSWSCFAFESDKFSFNQAQDEYNKLINDGINIEFFNKAIASFDGETKVNLSINDSLGSNILDKPPYWDPEWNHRIVYHPEGNIVECINFSRFIQSICSPDDFVVVKMDIEGSEFDVLESIISDGTYKMIDYLYCEFHERFFKDFKKYSLLRKNYVDFLTENGVIMNNWK